MLSNVDWSAAVDAAAGNLGLLAIGYLISKVAYEAVKGFDGRGPVTLRRC